MPDMKKLEASIPSYNPDAKDHDAEARRYQFASDRWHAATDLRKDADWLRDKLNTLIEKLDSGLMTGFEHPFRNDLVWRIGDKLARLSSFERLTYLLLKDDEPEEIKT